MENVAHEEDFRDVGCQYARCAASRASTSARRLSTVFPPFAASQASTTSTSASGAIIDGKNEIESARNKRTCEAFRASGDNALSVSAMTVTRRFLAAITASTVGVE